MNDAEVSCDLCNLPVKVSGFQLKTAEGQKNFCCEGCKGIYQMLHGDKLKDSSTESQTADNE